MPKDIRKVIYKHVFRCNKPGEELKLDYKTRTPGEYWKNGRRFETHGYVAPSSKKLKTELSLLLTCRDVEKELDNIVFGYSKLLFIHPRALLRFGNLVSDADLASIRILKLGMSFYEREYEQLWFTAINDVVITKLTGLKSLDIAIKFLPDIQSNIHSRFRNILRNAGLATIQTFKLEVSIYQEEYQKLWFAIIKDIISTTLTGLKSLDIVINLPRRLWTDYKNSRSQQWTDASELLNTEIAPGR